MNFDQPKVKLKEPAGGWLLFLAGREIAWIKNQYGADAALCRTTLQGNSLNRIPQPAQMERKRHRRFGSQLPQLAAWLH